MLVVSSMNIINQCVSCGCNSGMRVVYGGGVFKPSQGQLTQMVMCPDVQTFTIQLLSPVIKPYGLIIMSAKPKDMDKC